MATVTIEFKVSPSQIVPDAQAERIAWIERFGPRVKDERCEITLTLAQCLELGLYVSADGSIARGLHPHDDRRLCEIAAATMARVARETGIVPSIVEEPYFSAIVIAALEARNARLAEEARWVAKQELEARLARERATLEIAECAARLDALSVDDIAARAVALAQSYTQVSDTYIEVAVRKMPGSDQLDLPYGMSRPVLSVEKFASVRAAVDRLLATYSSQYAELVAASLTAEQAERFAAGVLPSAELTRAIRAYLFASSDATCQQYHMIERSSIDHVDGCGIGDDFVIDEIEGVPPLSASEFSRWKSVRSAVETGLRDDTIRVEYEWRCHRIRCDCASNLGVQVTLALAGRRYTREYQISDAYADASYSS